MLGKARPYFSLIAQSKDRAEVERAAADYQRQHPGAQVVIDEWRDHIQHIKGEGVWRARVRIMEQRSALQRFFDSLRR